MSNKKYDNVWKLLNQYNFEFDFNLDVDTTCIICKKLLKIACCNSCCCKYCWGCITDYLSGENKFCPGPMMECREQMINLDRDIQIDHATNRKIAKMKVKCPKQMCQVSVELVNMDEHLKSHGDKCPYTNIGCNKQRIDGTSVNDHVKREQYEHAKLLINSLQHLSNEMACVKNKSQKQKNDLSELAIVIDQLEIVKSGVNKTVDIMNERLESGEKHTEKLEIEIEKMAKEIKSMKIDCEKKIAAISSLLEKVDSKCGIIATQDSVVEKRLDKKKKKKAGSVKQVVAPFVWKIENYTEKRQWAKAGSEKRILSDYFYSHKNGYKMCLGFYPNGVGAGENTDLRLDFCLVVGEYDDQLTWPMKYEITLSLVDQILGYSVLAAVFDYDSMPPSHKCIFNRPLLNEGYKFGGLERLIDINLIYLKPGLHLNDAVVVECSVNVPI